MGDKENKRNTSRSVSFIDPTKLREEKEETFSELLGSLDGRVETQNTENVKDNQRKIINKVINEEEINEKQSYVKGGS